MDKSYQYVTMQVGWQPDASWLERRNYQESFDNFARCVVRELLHRTAVDARTIYSTGSSMREIRFSASAPLTSEAWANAIRAAVKSCRMLTDQSMWSFA